SEAAAALTDIECVKPLGAHHDRRGEMNDVRHAQRRVILLPSRRGQSGEVVPDLVRLLEYRWRDVVHLGAGWPQVALDPSPGLLRRSGFQRLQGHNEEVISLYVPSSNFWTQYARSSGVTSVRASPFAHANKTQES